MVFGDSHTKDIIACPSVRNGFGLGLNHGELSSWPNDWMPKLASVKHPSESVMVADAGLMANNIETNVDLWVETPGAATLIFLTPSLRDWHPSVLPHRPIGRHARRCTMGNVDGHATSSKVSEMGLQYYPGKRALAKPRQVLQWTATAILTRAGNGIATKKELHYAALEGTLSAPGLYVS